MVKTDLYITKGFKWFGGNLAKFVFFKKYILLTAKTITISGPFKNNLIIKGSTYYDAGCEEGCNWNQNKNIELDVRWRVQFVSLDGSMIEGAQSNDATWCTNFEI